MGRSPNETCWACSLLTAAETRKLHDAAARGDGCWQETVCHSQRSYYRKGRSSRVRRRSQIEEVTVPVPEFAYVILHICVIKCQEDRHVATEAW